MPLTEPALRVAEADPVGAVAGGGRLEGDVRLQSVSVVHVTGDRRRQIDNDRSVRVADGGQVHCNGHWSVSDIKYIDDALGKKAVPRGKTI